MFQLEIDFTAPTVPDPDLLATLLRERLAYGQVRQRQGVCNAAAAVASEVVDVCKAVRAAAEDGDALANLAAASLLSGIHPNVVGRLALDPPPPRDFTAWVDRSQGYLHTDWRRICLDGAALPRTTASVLPASTIASKPLPRWFAGQLTRLACPHARVLSDLFSLQGLGRGLPIAGKTDGRLRSTFSRIRNGLGALALEIGIDPYDAAIILNDPALVGRARLFYVCADSDRFHASCARLYAAIGWDEPVACRPFARFGSQVVPTGTTLSLAWNHLVGTAEASLPGRRYTCASLVAHHNAYVAAVGWLLVFCVGGRESDVVDFWARTCRPGVRLLVYRDKRTGPFGYARQAMLCDVAQRQVQHYWSHLAALATRAHKLALEAPWLRHADAALSGANVSLLFRINGERACPLSTADIQSALPLSASIVENAGRHYWQTQLYMAGVRSDLIDMYARHATRGTESATSTSLLPMLTAHEVVSAVQDAELKRLGIAALPGQGRRATR